MAASKTAGELELAARLIENAIEDEELHPLTRESLAYTLDRVWRAQKEASR